MSEPTPFKYGNKNSNNNIDCAKAQEKKDGPEIQQAKERNMAKQIPFEYGSKNSTKIDRANAHTKQTTEKLVKSKGKDNKEEKKEKEKEEEKEKKESFVCSRVTIMCGFSGKSYTAIPVSERYENDFAKKAKKLAKKEKEAKK